MMRFRPSDVCRLARSEPAHPIDLSLAELGRRMARGGPRPARSGGSDDGPRRDDRGADEFRSSSPPDGEPTLIRRQGGLGGRFEAGAPRRCWGVPSHKIKTALTGANERGRAGVRRSDADPAGAGSASVRLLASVKKQARCRARKCEIFAFSGANRPRQAGPAAHRCRLEGGLFPCFATAGGRRRRLRLRGGRPYNDAVPPSRSSYRCSCLPVPRPAALLRARSSRTPTEESE